MPKLSILEASAADYNALGEVMYRAVHQGDSPYSQPQREAWLGAPRKGADWAARLSEQYVSMAQDKSGKIHGFMSLRPDGYVAFAYILEGSRGQGLFRALYETLEALARENGLSGLSTHASLMARPAFEAVDFNVVHPECVSIDGEQLKRFAMEKALL